MKEDVLEQIVDDYLKMMGYVTCHNVRFTPDKKGHNGRSDIDVIGYHPKKKGCERVLVVGCKSWQDGFKAEWWAAHVHTNKIVAGRPAWKFFRELVKTKWTKAFLKEIKACTGETRFTYLTAVTKVKGDRSAWEQNRRFKKALKGNPVKILTLEKMVESIFHKLTYTPAPSEIGRMIQLMKSAKILTKEQFKEEI